jgi:L-histidine N-alpha-methyltransferase
VLTQASDAVAAEFAGIDVHAVVGDFERHLDELPRHPKTLVAFLGSTIGNLEPRQRSAFYAGVRSVLGNDGAFLLGTDLVKPPARLIAAYDDAAGVTAAFDKNVLTVINRVLDADFDTAAFEHVAVWDAEHEWVEMRLRSTRAQRVRVRALDLAVDFAAGEQMRTEISTKFRRRTVETELAAAGLQLTHWWTDPRQDFALSLSVPAGSPAAPAVRTHG